MTERRATIYEFSLPLSKPLRTADGPIEAREGLVLRLERDGVVGVGEATPLPGWTEPLPACRDALRAAAERFRRGGEADPLGDLSDAPAARHALSLALLDLHATDEGLPLFRYLGIGDRPGSVPVNATIGDADPSGTVTAAEEAVDAGYRCLKLKVGARSVADDVARVAAVREAVGDEPDLRLDANASWTRADAAEALAALDGVALEHVEQPLSADDLAGHAALRRPGSTPIALDESVSARGIEAIVDAAAADVAVLKPMSLGGVPAAYTAAVRARTAGVEPVITTTIDGVVARTAAVHLAAAVRVRRACGLATADLLAADLGPDPARVEAGAIRVPQTPGLGVTIDEESEHVCEIRSYR